MMTQWHYHYAGLSIASELSIPEWSAFELEKPDGNVDVCIKLDRMRHVGPPGRSESFLSPDVLELNSAGLTRDHFRVDKFAVDMLIKKPPMERVSIPLNAFCVLEWGDPGLMRLRGMNALSRVIPAATYRASFIESFDKTGVYWEQCAQLVRGAPVWVLRRPGNWVAMAEVSSLIARQWQALKSD